MSFKAKYYYVNARYSRLLREPITADFYYFCKEKSLKNNLLHFVSVECDDYRVFKDYYSLDSEFLVYVECERRYLC